MKEKKRIVMDLEPELHKAIKEKAAKLGISMKEFLLRAVCQSHESSSSFTKV